MSRFVFALSVLCVSADLATANGPQKVERTIKKEPAYRSKAPRYGLLAFGPSPAERVWLVCDGDLIYVDRNGNGDLTEPGEKVAADKPRAGFTEEEGYTFSVGDVSLGGRTHKGCSPSAAAGPCICSN